MARRPYWSDTLIDDAVGSGAQDHNTLIGSFTAQETQGWTLTRMILELGLYKQAPSSDGWQIIDIGIGLAEQDAFAAGVIPDPNVSNDEPARGWLYRTRCVVPADATEVLMPVMCRGDFRAQRKIDGAELYIVLNNTPGGGTAFTVEYTGIVRALYLLP